MFDDLDILLLKEAAKKRRKRAKKEELEWYRRLWKWLKARPTKTRRLIGKYPLSSAALAALLGTGLGAGATYGLMRESSLDDFIDDYDWDYLDVDDVIDELEKEAALEELLDYWY